MISVIPLFFVAGAILSAPVFAVLFGIVALFRIAASGGRLTGKGFALGGLLMGALTLAGGVLAGIPFFLLSTRPGAVVVESDTTPSAPNSIQIGPNGLHVQNGQNQVRMGADGMTVVSDDGKTVVMNGNGLTVTRTTPAQPPKAVQQQLQSVLQKVTEQAARDAEAAKLLLRAKELLQAKQLAEAQATLERLIKDYPTSSVNPEAQRLRQELQVRLEEEKAQRLKDEDSKREPRY